MTATPEHEGGDVAPHAEHHPGGADDPDHAPEAAAGPGTGRAEHLDAEQHEGHREQEPADEEEDADGHGARILS